MKKIDEMTIKEILTHCENSKCSECNNKDTCTRKEVSEMVDAIFRAKKELGE